MDVVFGAGPLGRAVARAVLAKGRPVRVVTRSGVAGVEGVEGVESVAADVADPDAARRACAAAQVVYHCAAPPYHQWAKLCGPLMAGVVAGASSVHARVVYGDNLYCYGPVDGPLTEDLPYRPVGAGATARARAAETLLAAHDHGDISATIGRASDFYGPGVRVSVVGDRVFPAALAGKPAQVLPSADTLHTFSYVEDVAAALVELGSHDEASGQAWHVPSAPPLTTRDFVTQVYAAAGSAPKLRVAPRLAVRALGLVSPAMKAVADRLYQTERDFVMDHSKYDHAFGVHATPHADAIRATLAWYQESSSSKGVGSS